MFLLYFYYILHSDVKDVKIQERNVRQISREKQRECRKRNNDKLSEAKTRQGLESKKKRKRIERKRERRRGKKKYERGKEKEKGTYMVRKRTQEQGSEREDSERKRS